MVSSRSSRACSHATLTRLIACASHSFVRPRERPCRFWRTSQPVPQGQVLPQYRVGDAKLAQLGPPQEHQREAAPFISTSRRSSARRESRILKCCPRASARRSSWSASAVTGRTAIANVCSHEGPCPMRLGRHSRRPRRWAKRRSLVSLLDAPTPEMTWMASSASGRATSRLWVVCRSAPLPTPVLLITHPGAASRSTTRTTGTART